jgi:hypothetical protein
MSAVSKSEIDWKAVGRGIRVLRGIEIDQAQFALSFQLTTSPLFFPICVLAGGASLHRFRSYPAHILKAAPG